MEIQAPFSEPDHFVDGNNGSLKGARSYGSAPFRVIFFLGGEGYEIYLYNSH